MVGKVYFVHSHVKRRVFPIQAAIHLFHRRWSVPVVAVLHRDGPQRFGTLHQRLGGAGRDTLAETLRDLAATGLVVHRDGVYALSTAGGLLGGPCLAAMVFIPAQGLLAIALKKWPLLVLVAVARGNGRFGAIKAALPGITSGALAPALKELEAAGLVAREVDGSYPPATRYTPTAAAGPLVEVVEAVVAAAERVSC